MNRRNNSNVEFIRSDTRIRVAAATNLVGFHHIFAREYIQRNRPVSDAATVHLIECACWLIKQTDKEIYLPFT